MESTIDEIANRLNLPVTTLERWIRQGRIPVQKKGSACVFKRQALEKWAKHHRFRCSFSRKSHPDEKTSSSDEKTEKLVTVMERGGVHYDVGGDDVNSVLRAASLVVPGVTEEVSERIYYALMERERLNSTGIGKGVCLPHPRSPLSDLITEPVIVTCFLEKPVDFKAIDEKHVYVLFMLLSPDVKIHLRFLSRLAFCLRDDDFSRFLSRYPDKDSLLEKIAECENQVSKSP
jgi:PTS system nitrogen regulatory IIA component